MAVTSGYFNSVNGDRKYNADQMSEYFRGIINEGVYQHLDGGLAVTAGTGLAVNVAAGRAIIQNRWVQNSATMSLTIAAASETYARKDAVVIRLNWSSRSISIAVKTGTPAASPVAPSMTRNSTTYEMALAYVNVAANATSVTVTDKRSDSTVCGWVTVAQSTSGEVDAMLNDMKTGFDGETYSSPGDAVRACDQKLDDKIDDVNATLNYEMGNNIIIFEKNKYIITNASYIDITDKRSSDTFSCAVIPCSSGDIFTINGTGGNDARLWCFIDNDDGGKRLNYAVASESASDLIIIAPPNSTHLVLNNRQSGVVSLTGITPSMTDSNFDEDLYNILGNRRIEYAKGFMIRDNTSSAVNISSWERNNTGSCAVISCTANDQFTINGRGGDAARLWCFIDSDKIPISTSIANAVATNQIITAPDSSAYLVLNNFDLTSQPSYYGTVSRKKTMKEIELTFEQGSFDGAGGDSASNKRIRTQKISVKPDKLYIVIVNDYGATLNAQFTGKTRYSDTSARITYPFSFIGANDFVRIMFNDASDASADLLLQNFDSSKIKMYEVDIEDRSKISVSLYSNPFRDNADIILPESGYQDFIQAIIGCIQSVNVVLMSGDYYLTKKYTSYSSAQKSCLLASEISFGDTKEIKIRGEFENRTGISGSVTFYADTDAIFSNGDENSILLIPRKGASKSSTSSYNIELDIKGVSFIGNSYTKTIIGIDATQAKAARINRVYVRHDGSNSGLHSFQTMPSEDCVGIRVGHGSNNGAENYVKSCRCFFCGKGYSICGEHYILEDCLAHHCKIGFAFGDEITRGNFEHPNIMIGCSIEGCYRLMLLSKNGATTEGDFSPDASLNLLYSTLICIGMSTETLWNIPIDEIVEGEPTTQLTLPILEILKGAYCGRIEADYQAPLFETGSGPNMSYTRYNGRYTYVHSVAIEE